MIQKVVQGTKVPAKLWLNEVEDSCMEQIISLASLPYAFKHVAVMPDAHTGKGMPIGGVLATKGVVIPNAVGVDIGCGMCAIKTNIHADELSSDLLKKVMANIRQNIPLGFDRRKEPLEESLLPTLPLEHLPYLKDKKEALLT